MRENTNHGVMITLKRHNNLYRIFYDKKTQKLQAQNTLKRPGALTKRGKKAYDTEKYLYQMYDPAAPEKGITKYQDVLFKSYLELDGDVIQFLDEEDPIYSHVFYASASELEHDIYLSENALRSVRHVSRGVSFALLQSKRHCYTLNHDLQSTNDDDEFLQKLLVYMKLMYEKKDWNAIEKGVPIPFQHPYKIQNEYLNEICLQNMTGGLNYYVTGHYGTCFRLDMNSCYPNTLKYNVPWKVSGLVIDQETSPRVDTLREIYVPYH